MSNIFLLVGNNPGSSWATTVREELRPLGELETVPASEALARISQTRYQMIIIDAGVVEDMAALISMFRDVAPSVPIVVATASPTWQSAKEVFMSGANDYIRKSLDASALGATLQEIISRSRR
jgi:DNA-binding response OmpR family regulator